jgi:hypothetical protein
VDRSLEYRSKQECGLGLLLVQSMVRSSSRNFVEEVQVEPAAVHNHHILVEERMADIRLECTRLQFVLEAAGRPAVLVATMG